MPGGRCGRAPQALSRIWLWRQAGIGYSTLMLVDPNHPFFARLWVRILCTLAPLGWAMVEYRNGAVGWAVLFAAAGLYLFWALFLIRRDPPEDGDS